MNKSRFIVVAVIAAAAGILVIWDHYHCPEHTLGVIDRALAKRDLSGCDDYTTPTGMRVLEALLGASETSQETPCRVLYIHRNGTEYREGISVPGEKGPTEAEFVLVRTQGSWRFDDIYCIQSGGYKMGFAFSFYLDHPYKAAVQMVSENSNLQIEMALNFVKGFIRGWGIAATW